jgi:hypothetical protein
VDMEGELDQPIFRRKDSGLIPASVEEYLNVSAHDGVWVKDITGQGQFLPYSIVAWS